MTHPIMYVTSDEVKFHERRVAMLKVQVMMWYNAHRDGLDNLARAERLLGEARRRGV